MDGGAEVQGAGDAHAHRATDTEARAVGTEIHAGPGEDLLTPVHQLARRAGGAVDLEHQLPTHQIEGIRVDAHELGASEHRLEPGVFAHGRQLRVTGPVGRGLAGGEHSEIESTVSHSEAHGIRIVECRQGHLAEVWTGAVEIERGAAADEEPSVAHPHRQQVAAQHATVDIGIEDAAHHGAAELNRSAAIHHFADAQRDRASDEEGRIRRLQRDLRGRQRVLGPVHDAAIDHRGLALLQHQVGGDHIQRFHALELCHTEVGLESGVLADLGPGPNRQDTQVEATLLDPETGGVGVVRLRQGHLAKVGAGLVELEAGSGTDVQVGLGHGEAQQVALQAGACRGIRIHYPGHCAAADRNGRAAIDHIGNAEADGAADLQTAIRGARGDRGGFQRDLSPIHQLATGHRSRVQLEVQVGPDHLEGIDTLQLSAAQRGAESGELAAGSALGGLEHSEVQRAAFHGETDRVRIVRGR